jgi:hypothetical protein
MINLFIPVEPNVKASLHAAVEEFELKRALLGPPASGDKQPARSYGETISETDGGSNWITRATPGAFARHLAVRTDNAPTPRCLFRTASY